MLRHHMTQGWRDRTHGVSCSLLKAVAIRLAHATRLVRLLVEIRLEMIILTTPPSRKFWNRIFIFVTTKGGLEVKPILKALQAYRSPFLPLSSSESSCVISGHSGKGTKKSCWESTAFHIVPLKDRCTLSKLKVCEYWNVNSNWIVAKTLNAESNWCPWLLYLNFHNT